MKTLITLDRIKLGPPTAADIKAEQAAVRRWNNRCMGVLLLGFAGAALSMAVVGPSLFFGSLIVAGIAGVFLKVGEDLDAYEEVPAGPKCTELYHLCGKSEAGRAYRQAVITQGRKFVNAELRIFQAWDQQESGAQACQRLYDHTA